jgi:hypothetical protein
VGTYQARQGTRRGVEMTSWIWEQRWGGVGSGAWGASVQGMGAAAAWRCAGWCGSEAEAMAMEVERGPMRSREEPRQPYNGVT